MISSVFASARALTLRLPRGSFENRFTSAMAFVSLASCASPPARDRQDAIGIDRQPALARASALRR